MKRLLGLLVVLVVLGGTSVYANDASSVGGGKLLSIIQFSDAAENSGVHGRILERRYEEYRQGRFAVTTLDTQHIR